MAQAECAHPDDQLDEAVAHLGDPDWAYCYGCGAVVRKIDGAWVDPKKRIGEQRD